MNTYIEVQTLFDENLEYDATELSHIKENYLSNFGDIVLVNELGQGNKAHFIYRAGEDIIFHFNLLAEVGERFKKAFQTLLKRNCLTLLTRETADDYFNVLLTIKKQAKDSKAYFFNGFKVLLSYAVVVVVETPSGKLFETEKRYSRTTTKHIKKWLGSRQPCEKLSPKTLYELIPSEIIQIAQPIQE